MTQRLTADRSAFTALLNALDDAHADVTEPGDEILDALVAEVERTVRTFDAAFGGEGEREG